MNKEDVQAATREQEWHYSIDHSLDGGLFNSTSMDVRLLVGADTDDRIGHALWLAVYDAVKEALT